MAPGVQPLFGFLPFNIYPEISPGVMAAVSPLP
jgi:hypothetical protein